MKLRKNISKRICAFISALMIVFTAIPLQNVKAADLNEGEIVYLNAHDSAVNSATGAVYRSGGMTVRYLKTRETNRICYCIQPGVGFTRTRYKVLKAKNDSYYLGFGAARENVSLAAMFGFPVRTAKQLGVTSDGDAYAATQAIIWEYITSDSSYRNGIIGTPAEKAYNNIVSAISKYKADKRYMPNATENNFLFTLETATTSTEQAVVCYIGGLPEYTLKLGSIEVNKTDEYGSALSGAYFTAVNVEDSSISFVIGPTNSSGYAITKDIPYAKYKIKESVFPSGYQSNGISEWNVELNDKTPNGTVTVNAVNKQIPGNCKIVKTSEDGNIVGIGFEITGNGVKQTVKTDSDGEIQINNLRPGKYVVTEKNYDKYEPQKSQTVTIVSGRTTTVTFDNILRRGGLLVTKTSEDGLAEGIKFHLYGISLSGLAVDEYAVTDKNGLAKFENVLISGKEPYTLEEIETKKKYIIPSTQSVRIEWNKTAEKSFHNILKKWRADIYKTDDSIQQPGKAQGDSVLKGAVYGVYKGGILVDSYTTDEDGHFITKYYPCGDDWTVREIMPSDGYLLNPEIYTVGAAPELYCVELNTVYLDVTEKVIKGKIAVIKHADEGDTGIETPEKGAEFEVYLKTSGSFENAKSTERNVLVCDEDGFAESIDLPYGTYVVHQTKGWEGREIMPDFEVEIRENGKCYKYLINNAEFKAYLKIVKIDSETGKTIPYAGAAFEIYDPDGKLVEMTATYPEVIKHTQFKTNSEGFLITPEVLEYGLRYSIVEVSAPYGYALDKTPVYFDITADSSELSGGVTLVKAEKANTSQKGVINICKSGEIFSSVMIKDNKYCPVYSKEGLDGTEFDIIADKDIITPDGTLRYRKNEITDHIVTTDGKATSKPLYLGKYRIVETKASYGMVLNGKIHYAELTYAGQEIKVTSTSVALYNERQKASVTLSKTMEKNDVFDTGNNGEIKSVSFGLYAAEKLTAADDSFVPENGLLEIAYCDSNGRITFNIDIPVGAKLYVREVSTDKHYTVSPNKHLIQFDYAGQTVTFVDIKVNNGTAIENKLIYGNVKGLKVDESGEPVAGAVFGLFAKDETEFTVDKALMTSVSGKDGTFTFEQVVFGTWTVREVKTASEEYVLDETVYFVDITEDGAFIEYELENRCVRGSVEVIKVDADYPDIKLSGAVFEIYKDVDGNKKYNSEVDSLVGEMSETEFGVYRMDELKYGGYFLYEKISPDRFVKLDSYFYFEIKADGEVVKVENPEGFGLANEPMTGSLKIIKTSDDGKVADFLFCVTGENGYEKVFKTDKNGEIIINGLRIGKYTVSEVSDDISAGYILPDDVTVVIQFEKETTVEMHNKQRPLPEQSETPLTGDNSNISLCVLLLMASASAFIVLILARRKKDV